MSGRPMLQLWNEWATQILVLLSFTLQIFLFVFARTRRHGTSAVLRILLWLVYLMADSTAVYTLGHLSINGSPRKQKLAVFWAPFLLVHLGSQDTITGYALEDNKLWPRHLLNLGVQAFGVAYVLYKHIMEIPTSLGLATGLIFAIGLIKYAERIWALKCATLVSIRSSINNHRRLPNYDELSPQALRAEECDEEELLLFAQAMLPLCKGAISDSPVALFSFKVRGTGSLASIYEWKRWNWKATYKVVEMELSLMYDVIYTKAVVIHTWYGYLFRLVSPLATIAAFVMFQLSGNKNGYNRVDVVTTYILLVGAFLLDMASVFSTLGSTWSCSFLWTRGWSNLGLVILSLRRRVKAAGSRGWSGSIGQFNLLHFFSPDTYKIRSRVAKMMGLEDWWDKWRCSETLVISQDVKELVFKHVWQLVKKIHHPSAENEIESSPCENGMVGLMGMMPPMNDLPGFRPALYNETARRRERLDDALNFDAELQEVILTWHVFTNVFLLSIDTPKDAASSTYLKAIKALSDYMVFLVAVRPDMIPGLELRSMYESTVQDLRCICCPWGSHTSSIDSVKRLVSILQDRTHEDMGEACVTLWHGTLYARLMLELVDAGNGDKPGIISCYEDRDHVAMDKLERLMPDLEHSCNGAGGGVFDMPKALALILDAWVRLLVFASVQCSRDAHASQINRGGELMTVVWLMEEHANVFFKQPTPGGIESFLLQALC
ncbi:hypothetical protein CFC21_069362 [Triticum aestivum]|uniref:DUF4220 domain-containing protein n=2 Tax=Triticum aestivum TaxID=4565 RepID=A0A3B6KSZ8_WHEAT|nr:uncharacterized protein LOC119298586 [Triticum dicoccoides]XP_044384342.1 uncharacterized protein LOC123106183 [Triticum aestivum]KAF7062801.1 hypothetical protein CFC21_069362 [Triticum aestivum]